MKKILILFAHPRFEKSRTNKALLSAINDFEYVTVHDLYETYPDFNIEIDHEKELLLSHEIIVWQFPFYMYSAPAMLKHWIDQVLEHGWAHGAGSYNLKDKLVFCTITTGGTRDSYAHKCFNVHTINEFLYPFKQTAHLCKMICLQPFMVQGTYRLSDEILAESAEQYRHILSSLSHGTFPLHEIENLEFLSDYKETGARQDN